MRYVFFIFSLFLILFFKLSWSCENLDPLNIKDTSFIKEGDIGIFPEENDQYGAKKLVIGVDFVCPEIQLINGSAVNYLFLDNQITEIVLTRIGFQDTHLFDYSEDRFGSLINDVQPDLNTKEDFFAEWPDDQLIIQYASRISPYDANFQEILYLRLKTQEDRYIQFLNDLENIENAEFN